MKLVLLSFVMSLGFSLSAQGLMDYTVLQKVFPEMIKDFERIGKMEGSQLNIGEITFTNASVSYKKDQVQIELVLMDYWGADEMFVNSKKLVNKGIDIKSKDGFKKTLTLDGKMGYVVSEKNASNITLILVWDNRFVLNIAVVGRSDYKLVKDIYKSIDFSRIQ